MPFSPVYSYQPFEICCHHLQGRSPRRNWRNSLVIIWTHECSVCTSTYEVLGTGSHLWTMNNGVINPQAGIPIMLSPCCEVHFHQMPASGVKYFKNIKCTMQWSLYLINTHFEIYFKWNSLYTMCSYISAQFVTCSYSSMPSSKKVLCLSIHAPYTFICLYVCVCVYVCVFVELITYNI
jgi:hypothetical protein